MSHIPAISLCLAVVGTVAENKYGPAKNDDHMLFAMTPLILILTSLWSVLHGFLFVGGARKKFMERAKKDGEKDVEERYNLPNLYAQGTSKHAREFNCIQRSHQHIFETFTQVCLSCLTAAWRYPITAAVTAFLYAVGRVSLSQGYAAAGQDAGKRYDNPLAKYTWYGVFMSFFAGIVSGAKIMLEDRMMW